MGEASVIIRDQGVRRMLKQFADRVKNPGPALAEIGETGITAILDVFDDEGSPRGSWPDLKPATKRQRLRVGKWPGKMLQRSGAAGGLIGSLNYKTETGSNPKVVWGTNKIYARVHHFGYKPRNIPARPYMVFNKNTINKIKNILARYISNGT